MPDLTDLSVTKREAQVADVISHIFAGLTIREACDKAGIAETTFRRWAATSSEYIDSIKDLLGAIERLRLVTLASADQEILDQLVMDGKSADTKPGERLAIHRYIHNLLERTSTVQHATSGTDRGAQKFLKSGPIISPQSSRMTASDDGTVVTVTVSKRSPEIVDAEYQDVVDED